MNILDIHTHHGSEKAIRNCLPSSFVPEKGRYYSVGIHPWYISENNNQDWLHLQTIAKHPQVLAIGEAGLDKITSSPMDLQTEVFKQQVELAETTNKPLIIHSVRTSNELIQLKKQLRPTVPWIIHGFRGNENIALQLMEHGFYLSYGEKYATESLINTPFNRMFIETDESRIDILSLYHQAAEHLSIADNQLLEQIRQNIEEVFFNR